MNGEMDMDDALHAATLRNFAMKFGWVVDADELIAALPSE